MDIEIKLQNQFYLLAETVCAGDQRLISNRASLQETMYGFFFRDKGQRNQSHANYLLRKY